MAEKIRYFKCPFTECKAISAFDIELLKNPTTNYVICTGCKCKWSATLMPSCCQISIKFVCLRHLTGKLVATIQSFKK